MAPNDGSDPPDLSDLTIERFGWPATARSLYHQSWSDGLNTLTLEVSPAAPGVSPVGSDLALGAWAAVTSPASWNLVETIWIRSAAGLDVASVVTKERMPSGGFDYRGRLIVPFAECCWIVELRCPEAGTTGIREALWVDRQLAGGRSIDEISSAVQHGLAGTPSHPADDPEWDAMVPDHPLSRLRQQLPLLVDSIRFHAPDRALAQPTTGRPEPRSVDTTLARYRHVFEQLRLGCVVLPNPSGRADPSSVCELIGKQLIPTTAANPSLRLHALPEMSGIRPVPPDQAPSSACLVIGAEQACRGSFWGAAADWAIVELGHAFAASLEEPTWYANFSPEGGSGSAMQVSSAYTLLLCGVDRGRLALLMHQR